MTPTSRIRRLAGPLSALAIGGACIWPGPVNEEPTPPPPTDSAPTITAWAPPIGPLTPDPTQLPTRCVIKVINVQAESPIGRQLYIRFYLNYLNGASNSNPAPIQQFALEGDLSTLPAFQTMGRDHSPQVFELQDYQSQLLPAGSPNTLWVWVSDGFADPDSPFPPLPGSYSTSFSWTIDLSQCPGIN